MSKLPKKFLFMISGGVDSIGATFFIKAKRNIDFALFHFNHGTEQADKMEAKVRAFADKFNLTLYVERADRKLSSEAEFRDARFSALGRSLAAFGARDVVTAHHLGDAVESYLMRCFNGEGDFLPIKPISEGAERTVHHPFILWKKEKFISIVNKNNLNQFVEEDLSNADPKVGRRNWIRCSLLPQLKEQQIHLEKVVRKLYSKNNHG